MINYHHISIRCVGRPINIARQPRKCIRNSICNGSFRRCNQNGGIWKATRSTRSKIFNNCFTIFFIFIRNSVIIIIYIINIQHSVTIRIKTSFNTCAYYIDIFQGVINDAIIRSGFFSIG